MDTPIKDFVENYAHSKIERLHMPGHKGVCELGFENLDITEIDGADCLNSANGIIKQSQENASRIFNAQTFYSTEGSSLSIRAMLFLALKNAKDKENAFILAGRNAHKSFLTALGLLDLKVKWLYPNDCDSYLSCNISPSLVEQTLKELKRLPIALYLTSPDYLGNILDIKGIKEVCKKYGVLLLIDNAHGSYLKFLPKSLHPIDLGADMCCDSAHKTLYALTGAGYLHLSKSLPKQLVSQTQSAMALFSSTSPSYLILQSLDLLNKQLSNGFKDSIKESISEIDKLKNKLIEKGFVLVGNEPLKITIDAKKYGYYGYQLNEYLLKAGICCEFYDKDFLVTMWTPRNSKSTIEKFKNALLSLERKPQITSLSPKLTTPIQKLSVRQALFSDSEIVSVDKAQGRIFADLAFSCPPAVPVVVCGEEINQSAIDCLKYYGIKNCLVIK